MARYNLITGIHAREIIMLKGRDCSYGRCQFCDYTSDNDNDIKRASAYNLKIIAKVTGQTSVLEVINSGNVLDLPLNTLAAIKQKCLEKNIYTLYFESYLNDIKRLDDLEKSFAPIKLRFRLGLESFNDSFRKQLGKPFNYDRIASLIEARYYSACLLVCVQGQTKEMILDDIIRGLNSFNQITINLFIDNDSSVKQDPHLKQWFIRELAPILARHDRIELLLHNSDLGVY